MAFAKAVAVLEDGATLIIITLGCLRWPAQNMLAFSEALWLRGAEVRVLKLGGGDVDTHTPMGSTVMAVLVRWEPVITRERLTDPMAKRGAAGTALGGRVPTGTNFMGNLSL